MAMATVMVTETDDTHWVAGGVASGDSENGTLLWRITRTGEFNFSDKSKLAQKSLVLFFAIHVLGDESSYFFGRR